MEKHLSTENELRRVSYCSQVSFIDYLQSIKYRIITHKISRDVVLFLSRWQNYHGRKSHIQI